MMIAARGAADGRHLKNLAAHAVRSPTLGPNLVNDWDAEKVGVADWTAISSATLTKQAGAPSGSGAQVLRVAHNAVANPAAQQSVLTSGTLYQWEAWHRASVSSQYGRLVQNATIDQPTNAGWGKVKHWHRAGSAVAQVGCLTTWAEWDELVIRSYTAAQINGLSISHAAVESALISGLGVVPIAYDGPCHCDDGLLQHHASTQVFRWGCTSIGSVWTRTNVTVEPGLSTALAQPLALMLETSATGLHSMAATQLYCAATGAHVLTFYAAAAGRSTMRVRIALAAGNLDTIITLTSEISRFSIPFTAGAGDVGVGKIVTFYLRDAGGNVNYAGDPTMGAYVDMVQAEAGDIPTPYQRSYGAAVSGIAPVYNCTENRLLWRASGRAIDAEYRCKWLYALPAAVTAAPLWALSTGGSSPQWVRLEYRPAGGAFAVVWSSPAGNQEVNTGAVFWSPVVGHEYEIRLHFSPESPAMLSGVVRVIDYTANTVVDLETTGYRGSYQWVFGSQFSSWYLGADENQINQWDHAIQGVAA